MDNLDDSEKNAKISDSAYSNSCSNSHSRRSLSSKSTRSGSNSSGSGSSGYCGKPLAYSDNSGQPAEKRIKEKDGKKKKQIHVEQITEDPAESEERPHDEPSVAEEVSDETCNVARTTPPPQDEVEKGSELMDISPDRSSIKDEVRSLQRDGSSGNTAHYTSTNFATSRTAIPCAADGFSCVISMEDGVVMYTTASLTATLGFPKEMWIGRSFIDFIHPRDRNTFASHITNGLAVPKNVNGTLEEAPAIQNAVYTMVCRIRRYRNLSTGFGVKERVLAYMPFFLKLSFKKIADEEGKVIYLVVQATPFFSAFKTPNELIKEPVPFVIRHAANGNLEYIDPESVPYLGYLPHDLADKDALQLYHPDDLPYLRLIYETIVKEGGLPRSKPYRILAQNGDFIKVETEWSSFINPWSRKLEFVIGKHHIIEGPNNPDVFQTPDADKVQKISEEEKNRIAKLRESIVLIMNEVLTKPAEAAKQQMTKRCQDLASFMESLMEEQQPKMEEELRLEIQDPENSYYERDSVMLGGISPHHDHHDSKSSTETPISYNQLNYNKTLQRYFDSHQPFTYEDYSANSGTDNVLTLKNINGTGNCLSPMAQNSRDSGELSSNESGCLVGGCSPMTVLGEYPSIRLTESLLSKHNTEMEKELMKIHRESRSGTKDEREKASNKTRQKKKEHLARCNAAFQPTSVINIIAKEPQQHGVKRGSKQPEAEVPGAHKHHCPSPRQPRRHQSTSAALTRPAATVTTTAGQFAMPTATTSTTQQWPACPVNGMNTFILGMGIPPQMSIMSPVAAMPGMIPMYYAPAPAAQPEPIASTSNMPMPNNTMPSNPMPMPSSPQFHPPMPCMMYGQAVYGPPFMYSSINPQIHQYALTQNLQAQSTQTNTSSHPLGLASSNYEEACKQTAPVKPRSRTGSLWREKKLKTQHTSNGSAADSSTSSNACNRSKETAPTGYGGSKPKGSEDRTDGESSYSSFYSSFFKTESGSAEDSGDLRKSAESNDRNALSTVNKHYEPPQVKNFARRKMDPPWMEQVCVTSELIYKYQILTRNMEEVLQADRLKMSTLEQPSLVNEQLGQLYLDLQLEGVASRLSLEEGITSSSSSGEENSTVSSKCRKKREYSKLVMIYEEDAPLPPPPPPEDIPIITITPSSSTAAPNS